MDKYSKCLKCWHFVEDNPVDGFAAYLHLDDGGPEYNHDAEPDHDLGSHPLPWWRSVFPVLFDGFPDGKIGPNSSYFVAPEVYR